MKLPINKNVFNMIIYEIIYKEVECSANECSPVLTCPAALCH